MTTAVNSDCLPEMRKFADNEFDIGIIDPPYGIKQNSHRVNSRKKLGKTNDWGSFDWDNEPPSPEYFIELFRVTKHQIIFGANHFISRIPYDSSCWIVFDKDNGNSHYADCELAWTSFKGSVRKFKYRWNGMVQQNMKYKEIRIHPTQKPVALYDWIIHKFVKPGWSILDTHLGSGSSRIAAHFSGHEFQGYELDKDKFRRQEKRFELITSQNKFFMND